MDKLIRGPKPKTHCGHGHEFTPENAIQLFNKNGTKNGRKCRECHRLAHASRYASNPETYKENARSYHVKYPDRIRNAKLIKKYGITLEDYKEMLAGQGSVCAVCGCLELGRKGLLHVDHDHNSGKVRALLCQSCNVCMGAAKDDPELLDKLAAYIRKHREVSLTA